jgi:hypothetical protein
MIGTTRATAATGAIALTVNPERAWQLEEICVHLSAAGGAGNLTAILDANAGAAYDVVILTQDMTSITDLVYAPERPLVFENGDKLVVAWANASNRTYGVEVKHKAV